MSNVVLSVPINQSFWSQTGFSSPPWDNPWVGRGNNAPFDQEFYLTINVACGGTTGYFPDGFGKPWSNGDGHAVNAFYNNKTAWYSTWDGENSALQIDSVRVWTYGMQEPQATPPPATGSGTIISSLVLLLVLLAGGVIMYEL